MEDDTTLCIEGRIAGCFTYENGVCKFPFKTKDESMIRVSDPDKILPSYSITINYVLTVDKEFVVIDCLHAIKVPKTNPLTYTKLRAHLSKYTTFTTKRLSSVFKGRAKDKYSTEKEMVEHIDDESIRTSVLHLFDRHFQPDDYYFVASYLRGPELLDKNTEQLQQLCGLIICKPTLCCFLSSFVELEAARGIDDMSYETLLRYCRLMRNDDDIAFSDSFKSSLTIYQRWRKEVVSFGATIHKLLDDEDNTSISYLLDQELVYELSDDSYCLIATHKYGDGVIASCVRTLLERVSGEVEKIVDQFSYKPDSMPLLLIQHCGLNHYLILQYLVQEWEDDSDYPDVLIITENSYHAHMFETHTEIPVKIYCEGSPPEVGRKVGLLILEHAHLWDSLCIGRLLHSVKDRWETMNIIMTGDSREMAVFPGRGSGAIFSDLYSSHLFPIMYINDLPIQPTVVTSDLLPLLQKGGRSNSWERMYSNLNRMSMSEFTGKKHMLQLLRMIRRGDRKSVRVLCSNIEQKQKLYKLIRKEVWCEKEWKSNHYYANEAVYSSRLKLSLHAQKVQRIERIHKKGICEVSYINKQQEFPCETHCNNFTDSVFLTDFSTEESFQIPLRYNEGLFPATVDVYSRIQTYTHADILYVMIDRTTPWRVLYTAIVKTTTRICLVYPDDC